MKNSPPYKLLPLQHQRAEYKLPNVTRLKSAYKKRVDASTSTAVAYLTKPQRRQSQRAQLHLIAVRKYARGRKTHWGKTQTKKNTVIALHVHDFHVKSKTSVCLCVRVGQHRKPVLRLPTRKGNDATSV